MTFTQIEGVDTVSYGSGINGNGVPFVYFGCAFYIPNMVLQEAQVVWGYNSTQLLFSSQSSIQAVASSEGGLNMSIGYLSVKSYYNAFYRIRWLFSSYNGEIWKYFDSPNAIQFHVGDVNEQHPLVTTAEIPVLDNFMEKYKNSFVFDESRRMESDENRSRYLSAMNEGGITPHANTS